MTGADPLTRHGSPSVVGGLIGLFLLYLLFRAQAGI
jgi:hypothetical protein